MNEPLTERYYLELRRVGIILKTFMVDAFKIEHSRIGKKAIS